MSEPAPTHDCDVIVVLGGPMPAMRRRSAQGVRLYKAGRAPRILMSGRGRSHDIEAEVMAGLAHEAGVPADRIVVEDRSQSTMENAWFSARIMRERAWRTALVVTDALHLPRALLAFRVAGVQVHGSVAWPNRFSEILRTWPAEVIYEALAIPWYLVLILLGRHRR